MCLEIGKTAPDGAGMKTIVYQGVKGAFSYGAALKEFGKEATLIGLPTFREIFEWLNQGKAEYGVLPIENSLIGSIYENYDLLHSYGMQIVGEHVATIEHCLLSFPDNALGTAEEVRLKKIKKVLSHPKALEQCTSLFQRYPWMEAVVYIDTAAAAAEIATQKDPTLAAIASAMAAEIYDLEIIKKGVADDLKNYTRFVIINKEPLKSERVNKCSLLLKLEHVPGALMKLLTPFAERQLNITKIESRPMRGIPFEYLFYLDFEFEEKKRKEVMAILDRLLERVTQLNILGLYRRGRYG